jgi:hypothetical protein
MGIGITTQLRKPARKPVACPTDPELGSRDAGRPGGKPVSATRRSDGGLGEVDARRGSGAERGAIASRSALREGDLEIRTPGLRTSGVLGPAVLQKTARQPGSPAARQPGSQVAWQPGSLAAWQPGGLAAGQPAGPVGPTPLDSQRLAADASRVSRSPERFPSSQLVGADAACASSAPGGPGPF